MTLSFDQFVQYGIEHGANLVDGVPWSFDFEGYRVTHENDDLYLITISKPNEEFVQIQFRRYEIILIDTQNYPRHITIFSFNSNRSYYI